VFNTLLYDSGCSGGYKAVTFSLCYSACYDAGPFCWILTCEFLSWSQAKEQQTLVSIAGVSVMLFERAPSLGTIDRE